MLSHLDEPLKNIDGGQCMNKERRIERERESCLRQIIGQGGKGLKKKACYGRLRV